MRDEIVTPAMLEATRLGMGPFAGTPGAIEASEKAGQTALVQSTDMPLDLGAPKGAYEALGFTFGEPIDSLFQKATLPPGWTRAATGHSMHSDILDEKGRKRVSVFYKAAFYDRRANCDLVRRFSIVPLYNEKWDALGMTAKDGDAVIATFAESKAPLSHEQEVAARAVAKKWLDDAFLGWEDPTKHWA